VLKIGFCGDDCNYCPRYLATQSGDEERLKQIAGIWQMIGWRDSVNSPEEMLCQGCASVQTCGLGIKECVIEKGVDSCGKCPDYPCEERVKIFKENQKGALIYKEKLSEEDYDLFQKAFFSKKERLDKINKEYFND
jgi:hypothetical protein